jgi:hypothetical protein
MRTGESSTEDMLAAVTGLWRSFFGEIAANQPLSIVYTPNADHIAKLLRCLQSSSDIAVTDVDDVGVNTAASLKDGHAVLGEAILTLQSSNPFPGVMDQWSCCVVIGRRPPKLASVAFTVEVHEADCIC